jgi:AcrB/AcrD/AcrF family protein
MIGFTAGAGIVVRNSILVEFVEQRLREGMPLAEAVVVAGAARFHAMLLTALAVVVGARQSRDFHHLCGGCVSQFRQEDAVERRHKQVTLGKGCGTDATVRRILVRSSGL